MAKQTITADDLKRLSPEQRRRLQMLLDSELPEQVRRDMPPDVKMALKAAHLIRVETGPLPAI